MRIYAPIVAYSAVIWVWNFADDVRNWERRYPYLWQISKYDAGNWRKMSVTHNDARNWHLILCNIFEEILQFVTGKKCYHFDYDHVVLDFIISGIKREQAKTPPSQNAPDLVKTPQSSSQNAPKSKRPHFGQNASICKTSSKVYCQILQLFWCFFYGCFNNYFR